MKQTVWLVRHPPVTLAWQKRCYGQSDPGLSREGDRLAKEIAAKLATLSPDLVIHSDLRRTRAIANSLAGSGIPAVADASWRERHFGDWEGRSWHAIYRKTGNAMDGMLTDPDSFRPGGGETTTELLERIRTVWEIPLPFRRIVIITHGGPIACVLALRRNVPIARLPELIPASGQILRLELTANPTA